MTMDPLEEAKAERGSVEKIVSYIPGYRGYKEKEIRRSVDKQVRDDLARRLELRRDRITSLQNDLISGGGLVWLDDLERLVGRLQLLINRVKTASYGYAPVFDVEKIDEEDLDRISEFDESMFDQLGGLDDSISNLEQAFSSNEDVKEAIKATGDVLAGLNVTFGRREDVIKGVS